MYSKVVFLKLYNLKSILDAIYFSSLDMYLHHVLMRFSVQQILKLMFKQQGKTLNVIEGGVYPLWAAVLGETPFYMFCVLSIHEAG